MHVTLVDCRPHARMISEGGKPVYGRARSSSRLANVGCQVNRSTNAQQKQSRRAKHSAVPGTTAVYCCCCCCCCCCQYTADACFGGIHGLTCSQPTARDVFFAIPEYTPVEHTPHSRRCRRDPSPHRLLPCVNSSRADEEQAKNWVDTLPSRRERCLNRHASKIMELLCFDHNDTTTYDVLGQYSVVDFYCCCFTAVITGVSRLP